MKSIAHEEIIRWNRLAFERPILAHGIVTAAAEILREMSPEERAKIVQLVHEQPGDWIAPYHHGWGTWARNQLRKRVGPDAILPAPEYYPDATEGNWDDYYAQAFERAVHEYFGAPVMRVGEVKCASQVSPSWWWRRWRRRLRRWLDRPYHIPPEPT